MFSEYKTDIHVKSFNIIARTNEAKSLVKTFYAMLNANTIMQHVISIKNWNDFFYINL